MTNAMDTPNTESESDTFWGRCDPDVVARGPFKFQAPEWRADNTCSHCGGLRPSLALKAIREGAEVTPTDKNYKIYVVVPDPEAGKTRVVGSRNFPPEEGDTSWHKVDDDLKAKYPGVNFSGTFGDWVQFDVHKAVHTAKCYFNHFSASQAVEFLTLLKLGKMKVAYPGHFYNGMCFARYKDEIEAALSKLN